MLAVSFPMFLAADVRGGVTHLVGGRSARSRCSRNRGNKRMPSMAERMESMLPHAHKSKE